MNGRGRRPIGPRGAPAPSSADLPLRTSHRARVVMELKIEYIPIAEIKPYKANAKKHPAKQIEQIKASIEEFGFNDPIALWHGEIVEGHGRYLAAQQLHLDPVPVLRLDDLTDEQRKAYGLVHNKLTMNSGFDTKLLELELDNLESLDMEQFGFELPGLDELDLGYYGDERERTNNAYNLGLIDESNMTDDFWQMPIIKKDSFAPDELIGFNYAKTNDRKDVGIHFYIDDYQFERVWNYPEKYIEILREYDGMLSPDFSLYMDMPMPMKIWNVYRSRQIGAFYQSQGIKVVPTLSWAEPETFCFCFQGIEKGSIVSVSTVGVKNSKEAMEIWSEGMTEAIRQIEPSMILEYGGDIGYDYGDIPVKRYSNQVTENWQKR